jgi:hypothetical protein
MRIIGSIDHPDWKITVFKMDDRLSVKLETGLNEQTYKFREGPQLETFEDVRKLVDATFLARAEAMFEQMEKNKNATLYRNFPPLEDEFETII